jgi:hypothetical protein
MTLIKFLVQIQCRTSVICVISGKVFSGLRQKNQQGNDPEGNPQQKVFVFFYGSGGVNLVHGEVVSL